ncbi:hypothetical protein GRQ63_15575 [Streptomyces sp. YIM 132580]|nr:hypothetical protein [Streptomyces sp. YIM 132580]
MIRIESDEALLGATRIAISPLWDAFCSMHLALGPHALGAVLLSPATGLRSGSAGLCLMSSAASSSVPSCSPPPLSCSVCGFRSALCRGSRRCCSRLPPVLGVRSGAGGARTPLA